MHYRTIPYLNTLPKYLFTWHSVTTVSAGVIFSPRRNNYPRGGPGNRSKNCSGKSLTVPKIVAQCPKRVIPYLYTLNRTIAYGYTLPNAIAYLNTCIPYLNTCITYLNTLTRLSAPYLNTLPTRLVSQEHSRQPIRTEYYVTRVVSQSELSTEKTHQLRQPIRIEYYVTRVVSQSESSTRVVIMSPESSRRLEVPSRLESARYSLS